MLTLRIHWDIQNGWIIDTPFALNKRELFAAIEYHRKIQMDRIKLMTGDKKEQAIKALSSLNINTIRQNLLGHEKVLVGR